MKVTEVVVVAGSLSVVGTLAEADKGVVVVSVNDKSAVCDWVVTLIGIEVWDSGTVVVFVDLSPFILSSPTSSSSSLLFT